MISLSLLYKMRKLTLYLLACLFLFSCSIFKPKELPYPSGLIFPLEKDGEMTYQGRIIELIEKANGSLYFSTQKGFVYCVDGEKREVLWKFKASNPIISPSHLSKEKVYVIDSKNIIYCLDKKGSALWREGIGENITSRLREDQGNIYFGTNEGGFFALNSQTGDMFWRYQAGGAIRSNPVFNGSFLIFGCDDGNLYFLNQIGKLVDKFEIGSKIEASLLVDKNNLYLGSEDHYFYCLNLTKRKLKWKVKTGGKILSQPIVDEKRVFFIAWDGVLYSLNKKNGTILWWQSLPSRSFYRLEIAEKKIVASSLSSKIVCFDIETGEKQGEYETIQELKSNPLWLDPYLLVNLYDFHKEEGKLLFLKKEVKAFLTPSKPSPLKIGEDVAFTASATGFFQPKYEFFLKQAEKKDSVQEISEKGLWEWFPEKVGSYSIGVRVTDEKEVTETEIPFIIERLITEKPDLILFNGKIQTMAEGEPWVEALAVTKDKILFAGKSGDALDLRADQTVVIDMGGNFALPGFNDSRVNMLEGGLSLLGKEISEEAELDKMDKEEVKKILLKALSEASKFGITTIQDISLDFALEAYKEFLEADKLTVRIILSGDLNWKLDKIKEFREKFKDIDSNFIKFGAVRGDLDGSLSDRKAALSAPYSDKPGSEGKLLIPAKKLNNKIKVFDKERYQVALGASGDKAISIALDGIEETLKNEGRKERRHRIEKIQLLDSKRVEKFARLKIPIVGCPFQLIKEREEAEKRVGSKRMRGMFPWKTLLNNKAEVAFASDWPQGSLNPLFSIYVALTRKTINGEPLDSWIPWERITIEQALAAFTKAAARACLEEKIKGTLEKNKLADIIVLSKNLYEVSAEDILESKVIMTFLGGRLVYMQPGFGIQVFDPKIFRLLNILFFSINLRTIQI
jgi:predicted amidohydrolase YtcJ/outer membrane protein assembly factor BamB